MNILPQFGIVLYFIYLTKAISFKEPVDIVAVDEPWIDHGIIHKRNGMPQHIFFDLKAIKQNLPTKLNLTKNEYLGEQKQIYVIDNVTDGSQNWILKRESIAFDQSVGEYQDVANGAAFTVTCTKMDQGDCIPILMGSFMVNGSEYEIEPIPIDSPPSRVKRSSSKQVEVVKAGNTLYAIYERDPPKPCKGDYRTKEYGKKYGSKKSSKQNALNDLIEPTALPFKKNIQIVDAGEPGFSRRRVVTAAQTLKSRQAGNHYVVELLVVVDHSLYQRWYDRSRKKSTAAKDADAKSKIRQYFAHVVNGIDLRYKSIREPDFSIGVAVTGYIIADNPATAIWSKERVSSTPRDLLSIQTALKTLINWRRGVPLPEHDHLMLFTGHDLYSERSWDPRDTSVAGYATVAAMCRRDSASVCEDHGGFGGINTATHELGHSLGALHDGDGNGCSGNDQYIMTASGGRTDARTELNPWKFSPCSIRSFRRFVTSMRWRNCLKDEAIIYDEEEFGMHVSQKPGQLYEPNEQCSQHLGTESFYGWGRSLGKFEDVCTRMACKKPDTRTSYSILTAARGTSCGNKKWCIDGVCTYSKDAPAREDKCVHGDSKRKFDGKTCREIVAEFSGNCYEPFYSELCCESCKNITNPTRAPGPLVGECKFGDKSQWCFRVKTKPYLCYPNEDLCCGTCKQFSTGVKGCEYGDHQRHCDRQYCGTPGNEQYTQSCCNTCEDKSRPITTRGPFIQRTTRRPFRRTRRPRPKAPYTTPQIPATTPALVQDPLPADGWCLKPDANYFIVSCTKLHEMISNLCTMSAFQSRCCEPCSGKTPITTDPIAEQCVDSKECRAADLKKSTCYDKATRDRCCATCKQFETGNPDCMYGDRNRRCALYVNFSPRICQRNSDICCNSCQKAGVEPTRRVVITRQTEINGAPHRRRGNIRIWFG